MDATNAIWGAAVNAYGGTAVKSNNYTLLGILNAGATIFAEGDCFIAPLVLTRPVVVTGLGVYVNTAGTAGSVARIGVYRGGATGGIGALLSDLGTVGTESSGPRTLATNLSLQPGWYYVAVAVQGGAATRAQYLLMYPDGALMPHETAGFSYSYGVSGITGAFPDDLGALSPVTSGPRTYITIQ